MSAEPLGIVFWGTPELAVSALRVCAAKGRLLGVVTQPDRPAGRGHALRAPPVKVAAAALAGGVPVWQPEKLKEPAPAWLHQADVFVVQAYGKLLPQRLLDLPRLGAVNLHCSLLPRWRGASPLQAALRAGDAETGVCVMKMVKALDAGPVYLAERIALRADHTLPQLHDEMAAASATAIARWLDGGWQQQPVLQNESAATFCGKLDDAHGHLDFFQPMCEVDRWVRAYTPMPGCWAAADGSTRWNILSVSMRPAVRDVAPGVVRVQARELVVGCADGALALLRIQAAGHRAMDAAAWLNGHAAPECLG